QHDVRRSRGECSALAFGANHRVQDGFEAVASRFVVEYAIAHRSSVESTVGGDYFVTEGAADLLYGRAARGREFMGDLVRIDDARAELGEAFACGAFAAADAACQADDEWLVAAGHGVQVRRTAPGKAGPRRCASASMLDCRTRNSACIALGCGGSNSASVTPSSCKLSRRCRACFSAENRPSEM